MALRKKTSNNKTRDYVVFYLNGERVEVRGADLFLPLANYLRERRNLTGTKITCAEGDCGACTVLVSKPKNRADGGTFKSINSCIAYVYLLDLCHVVTIEGIQNADGTPNPLQQSFATHHGAQCGFCTPGFICALSAMNEDLLREKATRADDKKVKNYTTGNLCRCTGYQPIIEAATNVDLKNFPSLEKRYLKKDLSRHKELSKLSKIPFQAEFSLSQSTGKLFLPNTLKQATAFFKSNPTCRLTAGASDLGVLTNKGRLQQKVVMGLGHIDELHQFGLKKIKGKSYYYVGAQVTLSQLEDPIKKYFPEFSTLLHIFASPQIKNKATLIGNAANASPIADSIPFLVVSGARFHLVSGKKERIIPADQFYLGYKKLDLRSDEIIVGISIPLLEKGMEQKLMKLSLRRDLDISAVTFAVQLKRHKGKIEKCRLAFGGVGPTVARITQLEKLFEGSILDEQTIALAAKMLPNLIYPISDVRGSAEHRLRLAQNCLLKWGQLPPLHELINQENFKKLPTGECFHV